MRLLLQLASVSGRLWPEQPHAPIFTLHQPGAAPAFPALQFYDIPVVSLRSAVWRNLAAGIEGFQVSTASS